MRLVEPVLPRQACTRCDSIHVIKPFMVSRRNAVIGLMFPAIAVSLPMPVEASNKADVAARKEKLAAIREASKKGVDPGNALSESSSPVVDKNASRATELMSSKTKRLAALREKAAKIRSGEQAPTF